VERGRFDGSGASGDESAINDTVLGRLQAKHGTHLLGLEGDDLESFHPQLGNYGAFVTAPGFNANPLGCMRGLAKQREPHGRWDHCQLGGTRHGH
jgi:hypothetical protein